ncbi:hypothetical protein CEXT_269841 [Caerostris extrusa]|uniref:Transmembrane protein n=1 Tax=Caerostris extrusa TaxID=172846 RepID=A0AAV4NN23_CAEEX|nr:hypothetical protein CEXT_269841 [Caerostris extrusa]
MGYCREFLLDDDDEESLLRLIGWVSTNLLRMLCSACSFTVLIYCERGYVRRWGCGREFLLDDDDETLLRLNGWVCSGNQSGVVRWKVVVI